MDLTARRYAIMSQVFQSGGHTITMEAGVVVPDEDAQDITITHNKNKIPFQASITIIEIPTGGFESDTTYGTGGAGIQNGSRLPLAGYRSRLTTTPGTASSVYNCDKTTTNVKFIAYGSNTPFRAGVEYVYEIMWID